jgi:hypothetical protein
VTAGGCCPGSCKPLWKDLEVSQLVKVGPTPGVGAAGTACSTGLIEEQASSASDDSKVMRFSQSLVAVELKPDEPALRDRGTDRSFGVVQDQVGYRHARKLDPPTSSGTSKGLASGRRRDLCVRGARAGGRSAGRCGVRGSRLCRECVGAGSPVSYRDAFPL